uniref:Uncharacterized protein n=1 Tax=Kalanchoe fedtschenkoi TaxID=63787 RepID=A0A7N0T6Q3_KALFE
MDRDTQSCSNIWHSTARLIYEKPAQRPNCYTDGRTQKYLKNVAIYNLNKLLYSEISVIWVAPLN